MKKYVHRIDWENEKILISHTFAKDAQNANSPAYKQLMEIRKAHPGYGIKVYTTKITQTKQNYKGLNFDEMRRCIIEWDGECSANLATLDKAITDKVPYPKVKQWYLNIYGDRYKRAIDVSVPTEEDTAAVGNTDTAAVNC